MAASLRSVSAHHVSHLRSHWSRRGHMSRGTCNVRQIVRKKANGKKLKETDTDKFPSEKKLSRKFFFRISRRIWQFCRDLSSSLVGKFRQVTRDAISDLCTDTVRHKYPVARPDGRTYARRRFVWFPMDKKSSHDSCDDFVKIMWLWIWTRHHMIPVMICRFSHKVQSHKFSKISTQV